jgi:small subunit ribosomal protein S15
LKSNKKDHSSTRGLLKMVGQRRRLLSYLKKQDLTAYNTLLKQLDLRK